jgi:hypothetical protein
MSQQPQQAQPPPVSQRQQLWTRDLYVGAQRQLWQGAWAKALDAPIADSAIAAANSTAHVLRGMERLQMAGMFLAGRLAACDFDDRKRYAVVMAVTKEPLSTRPSTFNPRPSTS